MTTLTFSIIVLAAVWLYCGVCAVRIHWGDLGDPEGLHEWICLSLIVLFGPVSLDCAIKELHEFGGKP